MRVELLSTAEDDLAEEGGVEQTEAARDLGG